MTRSDTPPGYTCPLCGAAASSRNDVYVHLQVDHRKSAICEALVEATDVKRSEPVVAGN
jgi:transcription elongation factor Elf1